MATIDLAAFRQREEQGLLTCRAHPGGHLLIWNYTSACQFSRAWDAITRQARGLITTPDGQIVARPFEKFFNLDEQPGDLPAEPWTATAKMDGSLGILYWLDGVPRIATRGSFTSEQAIQATAMLHRTDPRRLRAALDPRVTYLFEIIYPGNRIVVDYGTREELVLLAAIETETGVEQNIHTGEQQARCADLFPLVARYDGLADLAHLRAIQEENAEGFVIRFASGLRVKLKFAEYVRLHRLLTQLNARVIWDLLRTGQPFDDVLERVPDEFFAWVTRTRARLLASYWRIWQDCHRTYEQVRDLPTRKEQAAIATRTPYAAMVFSLLDGRDPAEQVWKQVRPGAERPFRSEEQEETGV